MPTRQNPFYQYRNPAIGQAFGSLAALFGQQGTDAKAQSVIAENQAQAGAAQALAGYRGEQTRGRRDINDAMVAPPTTLAELFMSGGRATDDPLVRNPNYVEPPPTDFGLMAGPTPEPQSMFQPNRTANDKVAAAIQEALIRGVKVDDIAKLFGQGAFLNAVNAGKPEEGMGYMPLFGQMPTANTALSTGRQDAMSARDAAEDLTKQGTINATNLERERMQQGGLDARQQFSTLNTPVSAGNNADVVVTPARGKALGLTPDADGRYVLRGRTTVGTGQDQQPGSLGGVAVAGRDRVVGTGGTGGTSAGKPLRFEKSQIEAVNNILVQAATKLDTTIPVATRDLIRDNAAKHYRDPASPEFGDLANATARSLREFFGDAPAQVGGGMFGGRKVLVPQSVVASVRKALDAGVDADKAFKTIAQRTGYTRKQIEDALNAQQPAR
jgi:hypothetical protein